MKRRRVEEAFSAEDVAAALSDPKAVHLGPDEHAVVDAVKPKLADNPAVYQRGGYLVELRSNPEPAASGRQGPAYMATIEQPRLRELISASVKFFKARGTEYLRTAVPQPIVGAVAARHQWHGVRALAGITEAPTLRADGSLLDQPGYDAATGLVFVPRERFAAIPPVPTREDARAAAEELLSIVADFPFEAPEHQSAWLALVLTLAARPAIDGCVPLMLIDANTRGSGKTLLAEAAGIIATGASLSVMAPVREDDEQRKRITTLALAGTSAVLIDNVAGALGGASLDAALTATDWSDRLLGSNATVRVPLRIVWVATGNNVALAGDLVRRTLHIRLRSREERPEERTGFQRPELLGFIRENRPRLLVAALTIVRAFFVAGRPTQGVVPWGSFGAWGRVIRESIVWIGLPDPALTRRELSDASDRNAEILARLIEGWSELPENAAGTSVAESLRLLREYPSRYATLRDALAESCATAPDRLDPGQVARVLRRYRDRVAGGRAIARAKKSKAGILWKVEGQPPPRGPSDASDVGDAGDADLPCEPSPASSSSPAGRPLPGETP